MFGSLFHRYVYIISLAGIGFFLPLSETGTSVFIFSLVISWMIEKNPLKRDWRNERIKPALIFMALFAIYLIWMLNTENFSDGLSKLRLKLPVLLIPLVISSSDEISEKQMRLILSSFLAGVLIASLAGIINYYVISDSIYDRREISLFISHIRLSIMVCLSVFLSFQISLKIRERNLLGSLAYVAIALWFTCFLFILLSATGIFIFMIIAVFSAIWISDSISRKIVRWSIIIIPVFSILLIIVLISHEAISYFELNESQVIDAAAYTENGNKYTHYPEKEDIENGYFVWRYINEEELRNQWNRISELDYDGSDEKGHELRYTLIRYMSSFGIRKDSLGITKLDKQDVKLIESGYANCRYKDGAGIKDKIYEQVWQIDYYIKGGNPQGHSITQRIEFIRTAWRIYLRHPVFGTGTGDLADEFSWQYKNDRSLLDTDHRYISHNQYLTVLVTFGPAGLLLFILTIFLPVIIRKAYKNYLFIIFFIIILISMINEDTLETHTGVSFFAYFYALLLITNNDSIKA